MYVTISVNSTVSMRGRHMGHASTYHRNAQPVRTAWQGKSCCCDVNDAGVLGRQQMQRTSRAVGAVMLASVDNHRGPGGAPEGHPAGQQRRGAAQIKGHVPRSPLYRSCGVREYWSGETGVGADVSGKDTRRCAVEVYGRVCRVVLRDGRKRAAV